jgi:hypothetical protein
MVIKAKNKPVVFSVEHSGKTEEDIVPATYVESSTPKLSITKLNHLSKRKRIGYLRGMEPLNGRRNSKMSLCPPRGLLAFQRNMFPAN